MSFASIFRLRLAKAIGIGYGVMDFPDAPIKLAIHGLTDLQRLSSCAKEPETVAWLRENVTADSVLYDVGANVGAYSFVAASLSKNKAKVFAFEPSFSTFATLSENILKNGFSSVTPLLVALGAKPGFLSLNFSSVESGAAKHNVVADASQNSPTLPVPALPLDSLRTQLGIPSPTLLKVDVDGGEWEVLEGARATFSLPTLQSVLIEIDHTEGRADDILALLKESGFVVASKHPRGKGKSTTLFNYIFKRA